MRQEGGGRKMLFKEEYYKNGLLVSIRVDDRYISIYVYTEDCKILSGLYKDGSPKNTYFIDDGWKWRGKEALKKFADCPRAYALYNRLYEGCRSIQGGEKNVD